jgi:hypothetical protein
VHEQYEWQQREQDTDEDTDEQQEVGEMVI